MTKTGLRVVLRPLPSQVRRQVWEYVRAVEDACPAIFRAAGVPYDRQLASKFLFCVGIRKLWFFVEGHHRAVMVSLGLLEQSGVPGFRLGTSLFTANSTEFGELGRFREEFARLLRELDLWQLVHAPGPERLLQMLAGK